MHLPWVCHHHLEWPLALLFSYSLKIVLARFLFYPHLLEQCKVDKASLYWWWNHSRNLYWWRMKILPPLNTNLMHWNASRNIDHSNSTAYLQIHLLLRQVKNGNIKGKRMRDKTQWKLSRRHAGRTPFYFFTIKGCINLAMVWCWWMQKCKSTTLLQKAVEIAHHLLLRLYPIIIHPFA